MCLIGAVSWVRGALIVLSQILGAIASAAAVSALFPGDMGVQTGLGAGCSIARGLFIEMFLTAELVFTIFMLAAEKHRGTFIAPVGIGLALFIAELSGETAPSPSHWHCAHAESRRLLYRWIIEPGKKFRSCCCSW